MKDHAAGRRPYPSGMSDEEWSLVAPYLTLMYEDAPQREYPLREIFNALQWIVRAGASCRYIPNHFLRGKQCISRRGGGWRPECSKLWYMVCERCCGCAKIEFPPLRR